MHDGRLERYYDKFNYAPIYEEFEMMKEIATELYLFSQNKYSREIDVKAPTLSSINVLRKLRHLLDDEELPTVFEASEL